MILGNKMEQQAQDHMGFKGTDKTTQALLLTSRLPGGALSSVPAKNETTGHCQLAFSLGLNISVTIDRYVQPCRNK